MSDEADRRVSCDGGGSSLGHPLVWYTARAHETVRCQYCGTVLTENTQAASVAADGAFGPARGARD